MQHAFQYLLGILVLCSFSVSALVTDADIQEKSLGLYDNLSSEFRLISQDFFRYYYSFIDVYESNFCIGM
jgi:hypothetical protein